MSCPPEDELRELIGREEQKIVETFPRERRLGLMEVARAMDFHWVRGHLGLLEATELEENLPEFGLNKALDLLLDESSRGPMFPLMSSTKEKQAWADSVLFRLGALGRCEALLEMARLGLGGFEKSGPRQYDFIYTKKPIGLEGLEKADADWYQGQVRRQQATRFMELEHRSQRVWSLMSRLVDTWYGHYIQYDADPEIDGFYLEKGILYGQGFFGQDSFAWDSSFGGQQFGSFVKAAGFLIGLALKHMDFCLLLLRKNSALEPRNLLTIPQDWDVMCSTVALASGESEAVAEQILSVLILSMDNKKAHCGVPGNFVAPAFIQCGDGRVIKPIWGCLSHPFQTMLEGLRMQYPLDWDRAVERREVLFREELYGLFPGPRFFKVGTSIRLRRSGALITDIDAIVFDRKEGVLGLFQLKWQDFFRYSLRSRESKKLNFNKNANKWVARVSEWLAEQRTGNALGALGISSRDILGVRRILLFVVGRNAAHFSGEGSLDARAAWGTWYKVLRIVAEELDGVVSLSGLFDKMISLSPLNQEVRTAAAELRIGDTVITLEGIERVPSDVGSTLG